MIITKKACTESFWRDFEQK